MKKDEIFFGESGLTSTSANHICNLAKEYIQEQENSLNNLRFYTTTVNLIGTSTTELISEGISYENLLNVQTALDKIADCKSLIAWLREAIKAREVLIKEISCLSLSEYCKMKGVEYKEIPEMDKTLSIDDYFGSLSIKERNAYYQLETKCAVLGKFIHPDGKFSSARQDAQTKVNNPNTILGSGRDTIIYHYRPSVSSSDVEDIFFSLQKKYREIQATLNSIKFECEKAVEESSIAAEEKFAKEIADYEAWHKTIRHDLSTYKAKEKKRIGNLKIIIPNSLKLIYDIVSSLGRK